jgi:hypothetical protein
VTRPLWLDGVVSVAFVWAGWSTEDRPLLLVGGMLLGSVLTDAAAWATTRRRR